MLVAASRRAPGPAAIVADGRTGWLIRPDDEEALVDALVSAAPGEVLVTATTRDLVAGSGLEFENRGQHKLKGIPEARHLFSVTR
jgi:hypothetical protein